MPDGIRTHSCQRPPERRGKNCGFKTTPVGSSTASAVNAPDTGSSVHRSTPNVKNSTGLRSPVPTRACMSRLPTGSLSIGAARERGDVDLWRVLDAAQHFDLVPAKGFPRAERVEHRLVLLLLEQHVLGARRFDFLGDGVPLEQFAAV